MTETTQKKLKILLVDDHPMFLEGMDLVMAQHGMDVVTAKNTASALEEVKIAPSFDIIFVDIQMPGLDGFALIRALHERKIKTPVIVMSASDNVDDISRALELGALGYMPKSVQSDQISEAIETVLNGDVFIASELSFSLSEYQNPPRSSKKAIHNKLSERQLGILTLVGEGYSNKEIALAVDVAEVTVKYHLHSIFQVLQVNNRTSCVRKAQELGIL